MNYIFTHQGQHYTPSGIAQGVDDAAEHNAALTRQELAAWALRPAVYGGYVHFDRPTMVNGRAMRPFSCQRVTLTTWTGEVLGEGRITGVFRNNLTGSRTVALRIRGNNGAVYTGRFGDEWSAFCRVRRVRQ